MILVGNAAETSLHDEETDVTGNKIKTKNEHEFLFRKLKLRKILKNMLTSFPHLDNYVA